MRRNNEPTQKAWIKIGHNFVLKNRQYESVILKQCAEEFKMAVSTSFTGKQPCDHKTGYVKPRNT